LGEVRDPNSYKRLGGFMEQLEAIEFRDKWESEIWAKDVNEALATYEPR
jgi:hypothetical protein